MPDQQIPFLKEIINGVLFALVSAVAFLGWSMKRQVVKYTDKVDHHETHKVDYDVLIEP